MRFSQRMGIKPVRTELQIKSMDEPLRNGLWNAFQVCILNTYKPFTPARHRRDSLSRSNRETFFQNVWFHFLKLPLDTLGDSFSRTSAKIRELFFTWDWDEVYDFIEFMARLDGTINEIDTEGLTSFCNLVLERELSGYRFVDRLIAPITDEVELRQIEEAIDRAGKTKLSGVKAHLESALGMLSDRKSPDYRNSVKESISAVEAMCRIISGDDKATLGQALRVIADSDVELHPALRRSYEALYGYASDEDGIRHGMLEEPTIAFEDAKYMLASCSAFFNYLIVKASKAKIKLR